MSSWFMAFPCVLVVVCVSLAYSSVGTWKRGGPAALRWMPWMLALLLLFGQGAIELIGALPPMQQRSATIFPLATFFGECLLVTAAAVFQGVAAERLGRNGVGLRRRRTALRWATTGGDPRRFTRASVSLPFVLAGTATLVLSCFLPAAAPRSQTVVYTAAARVDMADRALSPTTPVVRVERDEVFLNGAEILPTSELPDSGTAAPLVEALTAVRARLVASLGNSAFDGVIVIEADRQVEFRRLKTVMRSADSVGFRNISFQGIAPR